MGDDFRVHPWHSCIKVTVPRVSVLGSMQDMGSHSLPLCRHVCRSVGDRWGVPTDCVYVGKWPRRAQESPGEPWRAEESPGEHRRAQGSPGESRRAQESPGEPRRAKESPGEPRGWLGWAGWVGRKVLYLSAIIHFCFEKLSTSHTLSVGSSRTL